MKGNCKEIWLFERCAIFSKHMRALTLGFSQNPCQILVFIWDWRHFFTARIHAWPSVKSHQNSIFVTETDIGRVSSHTCFEFQPKHELLQTWTKSSFSFFAQRKTEMCKNVPVCQYLFWCLCWAMISIQTIFITSPMSYLVQYISLLIPILWHSVDSVTSSVKCFKLKLQPPFKQRRWMLRCHQ